MPSNETVVLDIAGNVARVWCDVVEAEQLLLALGFSREGDQLVRSISDDTDRRFVIWALIDMNSLFSGGRDWSPAELLSFYREQGLVDRDYRVITWTNPWTYSVVDS